MDYLQTFCKPLQQTANWQVDLDLNCYLMTYALVVVFPGEWFYRYMFDFHKLIIERFFEASVADIMNKFSICQNVFNSFSIMMLSFNPFPHIDAFWHLCSRRLFENTVTKEEIAQNVQFLLLPQSFPLFVIGYPFNYGDFLCFDKIHSKSSAAELPYEGKG